MSINITNRSLFRSLSFSLIESEMLLYFINIFINVDAKFWLRENAPDPYVALTVEFVNQQENIIRKRKSKG